MERNMTSGRVLSLEENTPSQGTSRTRRETALSVRLSRHCSGKKVDNPLDNYEYENNSNN